MNQTLMAIILECVIFFETGDESVVDLQAAINHLEAIKHELANLSAAEKQEFSQFILSHLNQSAKNPDSDDRTRVLAELPMILGLSDDH